MITGQQTNKLMLKHFLIVCFIVTINSSIFVGGYSEYTDTNSTNFKAILNFIYAQHPEVSDWKLQNVQRQLVNGYNYIVNFGSDSGQIATFKVYAMFQGEITLTSFTLAQPATSTQNTTNNSTNQGGDSTNQSSLTNISVSNTTTLIATPTIYYGSINNTNISQISDIYLATNPIKHDSQFIGALSTLDPNNFTEYQAAWQSYLTNFHEYSNYSLVEVRRQVVAGFNYVFQVQSPGKDELVVVNVFQSINNRFTANIIQINTALGFTTEQLVDFYNETLIRMPDLQNYSLINLDNAGLSSVKMIFMAGNELVSVICELIDNQINIIFS